MIAIACDHGALALKDHLKAYLENKGIACKDFGTYTPDSCDYPDFAAPAAQAVASGECEKGIVLCTTGIGASIAANKVDGIRCALLHDSWSAKMTRLHNDTNMMAIGAGVVGENLALEIVDVWVGTEFSGDERHQRRIDKVMALGAGVVGKNLALEIVDTWLGTEFSNDERHQRRIDKMMALEG